MERAVQDAGIQRTEVEYVNAHATSTPTGNLLLFFQLKNIQGLRVSKQVLFLEGRGYIVSDWTKADKQTVKNKNLTKMPFTISLFNL